MSKQKTPKGAAAMSPEVISDPRFANFATDPRYRLPSRKHARTKIDKRFSGMLTDEDFTNTAAVDRYGRKVSKTGKKKALERLYQPVGSDEDEDSDENTSTKKTSGLEESLESDEPNIEVEDDNVVEKELKRTKYAGYDAARGGGFSSSSEDEDEDEDDEDDDGGVEVEVEEEIFPEAQEGGVPLGDVSKRIAVVNLDWDNIRAVDLMAVFSSFVRAGGRLEKITVYPSEFGRERMEREEMEGPPKEIFAKQELSDNDSEEQDSEDEDEKIKNELIKEDDGQEFDSAQLRQYQLERLRYYYAVIICSDEETAVKIYEATDGTEYLSSANFFDLRFVPDSVEFDEKPRDECTSVPSGYRPTEFVTDALQHSKVKLTWDAEDTTRKDVIKKAFSGSRAEIGENDLKAYLGSDSSDNEEEDEPPTEKVDAPKLSKTELARQKMRAALGLTTEPEPSKGKPQGPVGGIEVTFTPGLSSTKEIDGKSKVFLNQPIETTAEAYVRKERERKARRKEKAKAIREGRDPDAIDDPTVEEQEPEDLGFEDPFFTTDEKAKEKVKKTQRKEERQKKREQKEAEAAEKAEKHAELELLMDDTVGDADRLDHFDIKEIARAEKLKKKKGKKGKKGKFDVDEGGKRGGMQEGFEMNVVDPRFKAVFEENEFAIDPSNPSFKGTEGMKKLLDEGRKRRKGDDGEGDREVKKGDRGKKRKGSVSGVREVGLESLVEMVKKKAKR